MTEHRVIQGDCLEVLKTIPDQSINTCVTSPPYFQLRDYGVDHQIGLEETPDEYVAKMVEVFREVKRVLRDDGLLWINLGDSYAGSGRGPTGEHGIGKQEKRQGFHSPPISIPKGLKPKDLIGIPWKIAFALQADQWWLRSDNIWAKGVSGEAAEYWSGSVMPESVTDRCTRSHEYVFMLTKKASYYYDAEAIKEPARNWGTRDRTIQRGGTTDPKLRHNGLKGKEYQENPTRNRRSVWTIGTNPYGEAHFATMPPELVEPCILAGCPSKCCPKCGAPWERVIERIAGTSKGCPKTQAAHEARGGTGIPSGTVGKSGSSRIDPVSVTTGWEPTCSCGGIETVPGTVLDPFGGSGTTGMVAKYLQRNSILIELNPEYVKLIESRLASASTFKLQQESIFD